MSANTGTPATCPRRCSISLGLIGWSYSPTADLFTPEQASGSSICMPSNPAAGALPMSKLEWMNGHYIRSLAPAELADRLAPFLADYLGWPVESVHTTAPCPFSRR